MLLNFVQGAMQYGVVVSQASAAFADVVWLKVLFNPAETEFRRKFLHGEKADALENVARGRGVDGSVRNDDKVGTRAFRDVTVQVEKQRNRFRVDRVGLLIGQPPVQPGPVLGFGIQALGRDVAQSGCDTRARPASKRWRQT